MIYGYARVSTKDQCLDRQIIKFTELGVEKENIFSDMASGKDFNRPGYQEMIDTVKQGDLILITSIDRLGRNYEEIIEQWGFITKKIGADIKVLDMPMLDTSYCKDIMGTFISDLVLQILSFQAESERIRIKERQAEGIAAAKARGVHMGRPRTPNPDNFDELYERFLNHEPMSSIEKDQIGSHLAASTLRSRFIEKRDRNK